MPRLPTLFLSHGSPNVVLHDVPARRFFDRLAAALPRPRAIVVASAHYSRPVPTVTSAAAPHTMHDFRGFEAELYTLRYPAPGAPALAREMVRLIGSSCGMAAVEDALWGFDHGAWSPLLRIYPQADVALVELSINAEAPPGWHVALGRALAPLADDGVLMIGSGSITHNLARLTPPLDNAALPSWAGAFLDWLGPRLERGAEAELAAYRELAPHAHDCHPSDEHLLPLFVALGAAGEAWRGQRLHQSVTFGALAMDAWRFDAAPGA